MGRHLHERPRQYPVIPQRHARAAFIVSNPGESNRLSDRVANSRNPRTGRRHRQACAYGCASARKCSRQNIFADRAKAFRQAMYGIERFELEDRNFHPYTSKFDYDLDEKLQLTAQELRGKKLFDNPEGGNCASCHIDWSGVNGAHPLFTDFNFHPLGVPRNTERRANADPKCFDMACADLCAPIRRTRKQLLTVQIGVVA
jgi:cytochrome c peroxidase